MAFRVSIEKLGGSLIGLSLYDTWPVYFVLLIYIFFFFLYICCSDYYVLWAFYGAVYLVFHIFPLLW